MHVLFLLATCCLASALYDPCGRNESIDIHIIGFFLLLALDNIEIYYQWLDAVQLLVTFVCGTEKYTKAR